MPILRIVSQAYDLNPTYILKKVCVNFYLVKANIMCLGRVCVLSPRVPSQCWLGWWDILGVGAQGPAPERGTQLKYPPSTLTLCQTKLSVLLCEFRVCGGQPMLMLSLTKEGWILIFTCNNSVYFYVFFGWPQIKMTEFLKLCYHIILKAFFVLGHSAEAFWCEENYIYIFWHIFAVRQRVYKYNKVSIM